MSEGEQTITPKELEVKTSQIKKEDFEKLKKERLEGDLRFEFPLTRGKPDQKNPYMASFKATPEGVEIVATFPTDVAQTLTEEQRQKFRISPDGTQLAYPKEEISQILPENITRQYTPYCIDNYQRRFFQEYERRAEEITEDELVQLIDQTKGEEIVFYTGAGISRAGAAPVWDMNLLNQKLHLEGINDRQDPEGAIKTFLPAFIEDPAQLAQAFNDFRNQLYVDSSTPAHEAITEIVRKKQRVIVITENADLKHEAEGSRTDAIHLISNPKTHALVKEKTSKVSLLITVGLGADDRAVIAYIKDKNPNLIIVALALPPRYEGEIPAFLNKDKALFGNCQEILPKIARQIN